MELRACCFNCGYTGMHQLPYRSMVTDYKKPDDGELMVRSSYRTEDGTERALLCDNCGWDMLEVSYWDKAAAADPFLSVRIIDK